MSGYESDYSEASSEYSEEETPIQEPQTPPQSPRPTEPEHEPESEPETEPEQTETEPETSRKLPSYSDLARLTKVKIATAMEKSGCPITMSKYLKPEMIDLYLEWLAENPKAPLPEIPKHGARGGAVYGAKRRQMGRPKSKPESKPKRSKSKPKRSKSKKKVDYEAMFENYLNKGLDEEDAIELVLKRMKKNGDEVHDFA